MFDMSVCYITSQLRVPLQGLPLPGASAKRERAEMGPRGSERIKSLLPPPTNPVVQFAFRK